MTGATLVRPARPAAGEARRNLWMVILLFAVAMAGAWFLRSSVLARSETYSSSDGRISFAYPAAWVKEPAGTDDVLFQAYDPRSSSAFSSLVRLQARPAVRDVSIGELAAAQGISNSRALPEYTELTKENATLGGQPAILLRYAYVAEPTASAGPASMPVVALATDVMAVKDGTLVTLTTAADSAAGTAYDATFERVRNSVVLK